jgi:hypothetical protein
VLILFGAARSSYPQQQERPWGAAASKDQFFTGTVMAVDDSSLTVNRTVLGKNSSTKTFILTAETMYEGGKPQVRAQVTIRYVTTEDGDRALRVIVRRLPK